MKTKRKILLFSIKSLNKRLPYTNGGSLIIDSDKYILKYFGTFTLLRRKIQNLKNLKIILYIAV